MPVTLSWYVYAKNNNNSNTVCNTDVVLQHNSMFLWGTTYDLNQTSLITPNEAAAET